MAGTRRARVENRKKDDFMERIRRELGDGALRYRERDSGSAWLLYRHVPRGEIVQVGIP